MKIFTYSHSQLPPLPPKIEAKVADLDTQIAGLINQSAGNYLALQLIERMLSDCTDTCDLNLNCIQIVAEGEIKEKQECGLKDLSLQQKRLVYSCSFTNSVLLNLLSDLTGQTVEGIAKEIGTKVQIYSKPPTTAELEEFIDQLAKAGESDSTWYFKRI